jgi:Zn-dependent alcohol dehydrogenase
MSTHLLRRRKRMKTRGAVVRQAPGKYEVVDLDVDAPRQGELMIKMSASGM